MWKILQYKKPDDFVIATGKQYTIKQFINLVAKKLQMNISWKGKGINEKGFLDKKNIILLSKKYFRPSEVDSLMGDSTKAKNLLKWKPKYDITKLIDEMVEFELKNISIN
jgi:GDPmannose 4,6-dehydratase